jgi:hypothetical protein
MFTTDLAAQLLGFIIGLFLPEINPGKKQGTQLE